MSLGTASARRRARLVISLTASLLTMYLVYSISAPLHPQELMELRNPLSKSTRAPLNHNDVRVLSFGGQTTSGGGLGHYRQAYPHRLPVAVRNVATSDLTLAAACTQSVVKEDIYDVITIEVGDFESTDILLRRLRRRFPAAQILLIQLWHPSQLRYRAGDGSFTTLHEFRKSRNLLLNEMELYLSILAETDTEKWYFEPPLDFKKMAMAYGATLHQQALPPADIFGFPQTFHHIMSVFDPNGDLLNLNGHASLSSFVQSVLPSRESVLERPDRNRVHPWGEDGDRCELWYEYGAVADMEAPLLRRKLPLVEFGQTGYYHKHAIEVDTKGGKITVHNPFQEYRMLYLTYMASSDDLVDSVYPPTKVLLDGTPLVQIDPYHERTSNHHLTRTTAVGTIPPGDSILELKPIKKARLPFRLVGSSLVGKEIDPNMLDFGLAKEATAEANI